MGATATITYTVTVASPDAGDKTLTNTVTSATPAAPARPPAPGPACTATVTVLIPALTITKTASASQVVAGAIVSYTIVIDNTGQVPYPAATISDPLSGVLDAAAYNADAAATTGTVSFADGVITWTGEPAAQRDRGDHLLGHHQQRGRYRHHPGRTRSARTVPGSNCGTGSTDPACTATVTVLPQTIALSDLTSSFTLSGPPGTVAAAGRRGDHAGHHQQPGRLPGHGPGRPPRISPRPAAPTPSRSVTSTYAGLSRTCSSPSPGRCSSTTRAAHPRPAAT